MGTTITKTIAVGVVVVMPTAVALVVVVAMPPALLVAVAAGVVVDAVVHFGMVLSVDVSTVSVYLALCKVVVVVGVMLTLLSGAEGLFDLVVTQFHGEKVAWSSAPRPGGRRH